MTPTEILVLSVKAVAVIFTLTLGIILVVSMKKDGKLTADEASKVVLNCIAYLYDCCKWYT
jgi:hypothetical protein